MTGRIPWRRLCDYLADLGSCPDRESLFQLALAELPQLLSFDVAYAFFVDPPANGGQPALSIIDVGLSERVKRAYVEHYFPLDSAHNSYKPGIMYMETDWRSPTYVRDEFAVDYMRGIMKMDMTAGLTINPVRNGPAMLLGFGRNKTRELTDRDRRILLLLHPHMTNWFTLMNRLGSLTAENYHAAEFAAGARMLSRREAEVAALICKRCRPAEIATQLLISRRTVERHVENIYAKLNVRTRRDLLSKLLGLSQPNSRPG